MEWMICSCVVWFNKQSLYCLLFCHPQIHRKMMARLSLSYYSFVEFLFSNEEISLQYYQHIFQQFPCSFEESYLNSLVQYTYIIK